MGGVMWYLLILPTLILPTKMVKYYFADKTKINCQVSIIKKRATYKVTKS